MTKLWDFDRSGFLFCLNISRHPEISRETFREIRISNIRRVLWFSISIKSTHYSNGFSCCIYYKYTVEINISKKKKKQRSSAFAEFESRAKILQTIYFYFFTATGRIKFEVLIRVFNYISVGGYRNTDFLNDYRWKLTRVIYSHNCTIKRNFHRILIANTVLHISN